MHICRYIIRGSKAGAESASSYTATSSKVPQESEVRTAVSDAGQDARERKDQWTIDQVQRRPVLLLRTPS